MIVFQDSKDVLQNQLCAGCDCTGFNPKLSFVADAAGKTVKVTDASDFGTGDSLLNVNVWVYDQDGKEKYGQIKAAGGVATVNVDGLNLSLLSIKATVVSTGGCKTDMGIYNTPATSQGELLYKAFQGVRNQIN